jgi:hypothetical protein
MLLEYLAEVGQADAEEVAQGLGLSPAAAGMSVLRATRQGILLRLQDIDGRFFYQLSLKGQARLRYLREEELHNQ